MYILFQASGISNISIGLTRAYEFDDPLSNSASDKPLGTNSRSNSKKSKFTNRLALFSNNGTGLEGSNS